MQKPLAVSDREEERREEKEEKEEKEEEESLELKDVLKHTLEEVRMVIPGVQTLFGFQLIAVFNPTFKELTSVERGLHLAALLFTIMAMGFLLAPAPHHRIVQKHSVSRRLVNYASRLLRFGIAALLASLMCDTYIVCQEATDNWQVALGIVLVAFAFLGTLWFFIPLYERSRKRSNWDVQA